MDSPMTTDPANRYRTIDVAVPGGDLRVGVWDATSDAAPAVLLIHGVTASTSPGPSSPSAWTAFG